MSTADDFGVSGPRSSGDCKSPGHTGHQGPCYPGCGCREAVGPAGPEGCWGWHELGPCGPEGPIEYTLPIPAGGV